MTHNHVYKGGRCIACDRTEAEINAAAQVGEEDSFLFNQSTRLAAAKVADEEKQYAAALDTSKYQITNEDIATIVETTIERCAQVAENWGKDLWDLSEVAAAIRAMKEVK